ncbi:mitochondrial calcium uniporter regulator 1 isoform X1 [Podarcis raffonei]|uniref:mitochondrial calcium uniporter regulator 1 isoform X1 n=2 Tax=Podarcis raffonei TaxID=65483 RepID=UPI00232994A3|nr:mitochondrial calcium uniporter regulator 1 isoform X1 [Podarcis raffonei]
MVRGQAAAAAAVKSARKGFLAPRGPRGFVLLPFLPGPARSRRCLGDWKRTGSLAPGLGRGGGGGGGARSPARGSFPGGRRGAGLRSLSLGAGGRCPAAGARDVNIHASYPQLENKSSFPPSGNRKLYFDTHAFVCLLEENGFTTQQSEIIVSALINIINNNMNVIYKDMVTKVQQEIALQQIMSHIGGVKKDMIILEKSEFSALRAENEKIKLQLYQLRKQVMDEVSKVRTDSKLDFNLEKSRTKELYSLNERKQLKMRTEVVELHAQQDRALTQTYRKIDTEVAGLKTMLESHKLDTIKYLAGSVFTCLTVALGFYRLWI